MEISELYRVAGAEEAIKDPDVAHLVINKDKVVDQNDVEGLVVNAEEIEDGVRIKIVLEEGVVVEEPVHMCFGVTEKTGLQKIVMDMEIREGASMGVLAHCVFPRATDVRHEMDAEIRVGRDASYRYLEKHVHSEEGGLEVIPKTKVFLDEGASYETVFELIEGRVGDLDIDYSCICKKDSVLEMTAKVDGWGDDNISIKESGDLVGEDARGVLTSRVASRNNTSAEVINELTASAAGARGHVDCKEIIQGDGEARAVPIVDVNHEDAHVTHEAAIGSVDKKQLETLVSRGLSEEEAVDLIIQGLLS